MEYCDLTDKKMRTSYYEEIQQAIRTLRKFSELRNKFNDHRFFIKETGILKRTK